MKITKGKINSEVNRSKVKKKKDIKRQGKNWESHNWSSWAFRRAGGRGTVVENKDKVVKNVFKSIINKVSVYKRNLIYI